MFYIRGKTPREFPSLSRAVFAIEHSADQSLYMLARSDSRMLHEFITLNRDEIIARCRAKVASRSIPPPTPAEIDHGVPLFLNQLVGALNPNAAARPANGSHREINDSAGRHGHDLLLQGLSVSQVVHDYGDICQSITELALETAVPITTEDFHTLNRCLDDAIAGAVTEYGRERIEETVAEESARGNERLGFLAHELRNVLHTATLAFEILKTGNVGITGSTGALLQRSLRGLDALIGRSLAEVRLSQSTQNRQRFLVNGFIGDLALSAKLESDAKGVGLTVLHVQEDVAIEADRQVLGAVVMNVLQNSFKFTRPHTTVVLRVRADSHRVLIEVEDECGGLPDGAADDLFRTYEQRGTDRTGIGLGLAFCRWAVEANGGRIYATNLPGIGCIFTIDLPRTSVHSLVAL
jgi:signal transduction histidine kinase